MGNTKSTKRALFSAVTAMLICVAMLIGTTFAWFTDSASTAVNKIQAGTLDIGLEMATAWDTATGAPTAWENAEGKTLNFRKAAGAAENEAILWEPGCTYQLPELRIVNNGNLALKYQVVISGIAGDAKLNEAIVWEYAQYTTSNGGYEPASGGDLSSGDSIFGTMIPGQNGNATDPIVIKGHMKEEAGNEYQGLSIDGVSITVIATQYTYEFDSTTDQYDKDATAVSTWDGSADAEDLAANTDSTAKTVAIKSAAQFAAFAQAVNNGNSYNGYTINLMVPVDLNNIAWTPIGGNTIDGYPGNTFKGTFNGNGLTISNLKVASTGYHATAALFGSANRATIKNVVIDGASITSTHYAAAILGYETEWTDIYGCSVKNATIVSTPEDSSGNWDNGDKVGGIVGYINVAHIANCSVENVTVMGYRDIGGIAGNATSGYIKECVVKSVSVLQDKTHDYKNPTPTTLGAIVGRYGNLELSNNKEIDVTISQGAAVSDSTSFTAALDNAAVTEIIVASNITFDWGGNSYDNSNALKMQNKVISGATGDEVVTFKGYGSANTIKDVTISNINVVDETVGDNEGAWEHAYLEFENLIATDVNFVNPPQFNGTCTLTNCTFTGTDAMYAAWINSGNITLKDCTFNGVRSLKIHEAYGSNVVSVVVDGCTFKTTGKPGVVIGNLDSTTSVTIKNSTFDHCAAGDQSKYIYESDTDVTTFNFVETSNTVIND